MTLDLLQVAPRIGAMAREVGARRRALAKRRELALALLALWDTRLDELGVLAESAQGNIQRMVADPLEPLLTAHAAPPLPPEITMVATDGSSIDLDRHGLVQCYLINVGGAVIRYGTRPDASLSSRAALYYRDEDLYLDDDGARVPMQGALVDLKRTLAEQQRALDLARAARGSAPASTPVVAVADGTLLLWQLSGRVAEEAYVAEAIAAYAAGLEEFQRLGVPVCSYVSRPNGRELVNLLRVAACPAPSPSPLVGTPPSPSKGEGELEVLASGLNPDSVLASLPALGAGDDTIANTHLPSPSGGRGEVPVRGEGEGACCCHHGQCVRDLLEPLPDRALMEHLRRGERSARFASRSPVLRHYSERTRIQFFYLNVGTEIARVEVPAWVGGDPALLDLVHGAIHDACARGWGYPPGLAEAHEQSVIRGGEREAFMRMVLEALNVEDQPAELSLKQLSKNRRAV